MAEADGKVMSELTPTGRRANEPMNEWASGEAGAVDRAPFGREGERHETRGGRGRETSFSYRAIVDAVRSQKPHLFWEQPLQARALLARLRSTVDWLGRRW